MEAVGNVRARIGAIAVAVCLAFCAGLAFMAPSQAYAGQDEVRAAATGVLKFNWTIDDSDFSRGSCILINEDHVLTAYHCTMFSKNELEEYGYTGKSKAALRKRMKYYVTINRDVKIPVKLVQESEEQDFAIFKLSQDLPGYTPLAIRNSLEMQGADPVYAVGFPFDSDNLKVIATYTPDDVTFKGGTVSKPESIYEGTSVDGFEYKGYFLQTDCKLSSGDSGGPMVDEDGNVVGVSVIGDNSYYYAVASDKIMEVLDALGIAYTSASSPSDVSLDVSILKNAISDANGIIGSSEGYDEAAISALKSSLDQAEQALADAPLDATSASVVEPAQEAVNAAATTLRNAIDAAEQTKSAEPEQESGQEPAPEQSGLPLAAIVAIIAAIVAIVIVIVVLVVRSRKKKAASTIPTGNPQVGIPPTASAPTPSAAPQPAIASPSSQTWQRPGQASFAVPEDNVSETTILEEEATDTVILFQAASGGSLTRMSTNEQIPINSAEFTIGRERSKVDYCLEGNESISRVHVRLVVRDGKVFCVDNRSANGTYVDGVKVRPGEEVPLKSGSIITLADEKFKYNS